MSRFYIKSIGASGPKVEYSQVTFDEGVNILHGPSNSGKSYVINASILCSALQKCLSPEKALVIILST